MTMNEDLADRVYRAVRTAVDMAAISAMNEGKPYSDFVGDAVKAAFECALGNGIIKVIDDHEWPKWIVSSPPYTPESVLMRDDMVTRAQPPTVQEGP